MLDVHSDMATQTHSPFEALARVIEHFDADGGSVHRTEAAGSADGEPLRATLEVSVPAQVDPASSGLTPVDVSIDHGLSVTYRAPSFPDPAESLPPEYPPVSVTATDIEPDGERVVLTVSVTVGPGADAREEADPSADEPASVTAPDVTNAGADTTAARDVTGPGADTTTFGTERAGGDTSGTTDDGSTGAGDNVPSASDRTDAETPESPLSAVRDGSVPPYDDTPYLRRLYENCQTFDEMSDRIEMDVSAETVRRYMIEADVHSPTSYETADGEREESDAKTPDASDPTPKTDASGDDSPGADGASPTPGAPTATGVEDLPADDGAEAATPLPDEQLVADGIGLPDELTLREVVDAVVDARTVHEVQRDVGLDYEPTRQLLNHLNVLDLVVGRVAAEPDRTVTVETVADRIRQCTPDAT